METKIRGEKKSRGLWQKRRKMILELAKFVLYHWSLIVFVLTELILFVWKSRSLEYWIVRVIVKKIKK